MLHWDVIMHVEDDPNYSALFKFAFQQCGSQHRLLQFEYADEARAYLNGEGKFANRQDYPLPGLALIDIKLPRVSGLELLRWIRCSSPHRSLPAIMFTTSSDLADLNKAYALGANAFVMKPPTVQQLKAMIASLESFWIRYNIAPDVLLSADHASLPGPVEYQAA